MRAFVRRRFGTARGLVRLGLALFEMACGRLAPFRLRHPQKVRRVVFVCLGNICRSAFAHQVAIGHGLSTASIGLSTNTGASPPAVAIEAALRLGFVMHHHRATDLRDFEILPGDLLLTMEVRHARALRRRLQGRGDVQIALLGLWCRPPMPHLHDPFTLSADYFDTCFRRLRAAVDSLNRALPASAHIAPESQPGKREAR